VLCYKYVNLTAPIYRLNGWSTNMCIIFKFTSMFLFHHRTRVSSLCNQMFRYFQVLDWFQATHQHEIKLLHVHSSLIIMLHYTLDFVTIRHCRRLPHEPHSWHMFMKKLKADCTHWCWSWSIQCWLQHLQSKMIAHCHMKCHCQICW